jgi:hypothetical protein
MASAVTLTPQSTRSVQEERVRTSGTYGTICELIHRGGGVVWTVRVVWWCTAVTVRGE